MTGLKIADLKLQKGSRVRLALPLLAMIALMAMTTGCVGYGNVTRNLSQDGAIVVAEIGSPWGVQKITRIGTTSNTVLVEKDGRVIINPNGPPAAREYARPTNEQPRVIFVQVPTTNHVQLAPAAPHEQAAK